MLSQAQHLEGLRAGLAEFVRYADRAGPGAPVPTTPDWTVRKLVVQQGIAHRWAAALLREEPGAPESYEREGLSAPEVLDWLRDGAAGLMQALAEAPEDVAAPVFLNDAPAAREFWARRQCHETTIHAVDALAAALGRRPRARDTWIDEVIALDGIDELLCGFVTREQSALRSSDPLTIAVRPDGSPGWLVQVGPAPAVTTRTDDPRGDVILAGSAVALYLTLWNRSDEVSATDGFERLWPSGTA